MNTLEIIFGLLLFLVFYTYIGYGLILWAIVSVKKKFTPKATKHPYTNMPEVTLFITAYNEEETVKEKMENCRALNYPKDKLEIVWVTDGSTDRTNELLTGYPEVKVYHQPERKGKTAAMNRGIQWVKSPIVVFTDANTIINADAILEIVKRFENPKVGCVAGEKRVMATSKDDTAGGGEGLYWKYESRLKKWDAELYSAVGAAGELFAIRTHLYEQMPEDTLLDDFMISMKMTMKGYVTDYCDTAYACERGSANMKEEEKRKVRIAAGGLQSIGRLLPLLNIFKYGVLSFQYISHRVLRWSVTPVALFSLLPINALLCNRNPLVYGIMLAAQLLFYAAGLYGYYSEKRSVKNKLCYVPYYFLFMNLNVLRGAVYLYKRKGKANGTWEKAKRAT